LDDQNPDPKTPAIPSWKHQQQGLDNPCSIQKPSLQNHNNTDKTKQ